MGACSSACSSSKSDGTNKGSRNNKEEKWLISNELALGFRRVTITTITTVLEAYSKCDSINDNMLLDFLSDLSMATIGVDDPENDIGKFYASLKDGDEFDMDKIAVLAILLGKGTKAEKASALYKRFNVLGNVPKENFTTMLSIMI